MFVFRVSWGVAQLHAGADVWTMCDHEWLHPPRTFSKGNGTFLRQHSIGKSRQIANLYRNSLCSSASAHVGSWVLFSFWIINCLRLAVWWCASHIRRRHFCTESLKQLTGSTDGCDTTGCCAARHQVAEFRAAGGHVTLTGLRTSWSCCPVLPV